MKIDRQDVAVKELLNGRGRPLRKATSTPNMFNVIFKYYLLFVYI